MKQSLLTSGGGGSRGVSEASAHVDANLKECGLLFGDSMILRRYLIAWMCV